MNLFPEPKTPYYIFTPPWDDNSSGCRALHLLCHALNESGQRAYLVPVNMVFYTNPALNTPILNEEHLAWYTLKDIEPISIYPDIVQGNPFGTKKVVRWLLAPAGAYGGDKIFPETDKVYGYTKDIAEPVLCLPTFDTRVFYPPPAGSARKGECFYAHKYDKIHSNLLIRLTEGMTRCVGKPEHIAEILRTHERLYVYERSEISINAKLCGCEVRPVLTGYWDGKMPEEFNRSQEDLHDAFAWQLRQFIEETQRMKA